MQRLILTAIAAAGVLAVVPQVTEAGCGGGYYGGYRASYRSHYVHRYTPVYHAPVVVHKPVVVAPVVDACSHPHHCYVWVQPGESLDQICLREYGNAALWTQVASYNRCSTLQIGQKLLLPSIYASGRMTPSSAPAPAPAVVAVPAAAPVAVAVTPPTAPGA